MIINTFFLFCLFSDASPSLEYWVCAPPRPKYMAGMETTSAGTHRRQPCQRSWPRCRGNPPRSFIQTAIVLLRLGWLSSHGGRGREQWPAAGSCADNWRPGNGAGGVEARQVVAFIFSTPGRAHYQLLQYDSANAAFLFRREKKNQWSKETSALAAWNWKGWVLSTSSQCC